MSPTVQDERKGFGTYRFGPTNTASSSGRSGSFSDSGSFRGSFGSGGTSYVRPGCLRGQWDRDTLDGSGEEYFRPVGGGRGAAHYELRLLRITRRCSADSVVYYRGGLVAGLRHGLGTALHLDGSRYTGEWAHGNMHGWGLMEYPGGMSYEGPFVDNARHGLGALSCPPDNGGGGDGGPPLVDPFALHDAHGAAEDPEDVFAALFPPALPDEATSAGANDPAPVPTPATEPPLLWDFTAGPWEVETVLELCRNMPLPAVADASTNLGSGRHSGVDCCCYRGEFLFDVAEGRGVIELRNGQVWEGIVINGATMTTMGENDEGDF